MTVTAQLSDDPRDKVQAVRNHDWLDADHDLGANYQQACTKWFAGLLERERVIVASADFPAEEPPK